MKMISIGTVVLLSLSGSSQAAEFRLDPIGSSSTTGSLEIRGVAAGPLQPEHWQQNTLHWVEDARAPLLEPSSSGSFRNIYAPSAVEMADGAWRVFYGGWDGLSRGNDHIYFTETKDFLTFGERRVLIKPGPFEHICNVNAVADEDGNTSLVCTVYPDEHGRNKPALYLIPGALFSGKTLEPITASPADIVQMKGYDGYANADINGMNVLLRDGDTTRLFFGSFTDFGKVRRATIQPGGEWQHDGVSVEARLMVNDVKKFRTGERDFYLMGLHQNRENLYFSISNDGMQFDEPQRLFSASHDGERYIVALGWVVSGAEDKAERRLLGVLYGGGTFPTLDTNRIFARWLQKKIIFEDSRLLASTKAAGPDTQVLGTSADQDVGTTFTVFAEDGQTTLGSGKATLRAGTAYQLRRNEPR